MYCPAHFEENRPAVLRSLVERFPLATVITNGPSGLVADHVPLHLRPIPNAFGDLVGHVARNNPLWQCSPEQEVLLVFQGESSYISPNWYATKQQAGKVVPTWNYAVVHAYATLRALHDPKDILGILHELTYQHEASQIHPWHVADAPLDFTAKLLGHIVGLEFAVNRVQGKWKVSQNQPAVNQDSVIAGLLERGDDASAQMATLVQSFGGE
jgi:transcriptional regulator